MGGVVSGGVYNKLGTDTDNGLGDSAQYGMIGGGYGNSGQGNYMTQISITLLLVLKSSVLQDR